VKSNLVHCGFEILDLAAAVFFYYFPENQLSKLAKFGAFWTYVYVMAEG